MRSLQNLRSAQRTGSPSPVTLNAVGHDLWPPFRTGTEDKRGTGWYFWGAGGWVCHVIQPETQPCGAGAALGQQTSKGSERLGHVPRAHSTPGLPKFGFPTAALWISLHCPLSAQETQVPEQKERVTCPMQWEKSQCLTNCRTCTRSFVFAKTSPSMGSRGVAGVQKQVVTSGHWEACSCLVSVHEWTDLIILTSKHGKTLTCHRYVSRFCGTPMRKQGKVFRAAQVP